MTSPLLEAKRLKAGYGQLPVVHDLDLHILPGEVVALLGANGAGKTTTILTLSGWQRPLGGEVLWKGRPTIDTLDRRARAGTALITETRSVFMNLSVEQNLRVSRADRTAALDLFPELGPLMSRRAGLLSGGEQQMLALARALARRPDLLLVDELSLGLAPKVVDRLLAAIRDAASEGTGVLLVEQQAKRALEVADRAYVLRRGAVRLSGAATELSGRLDEIEGAYLAEAARPLTTNGKVAD